MQLLLWALYLHLAWLSYLRLPYKKLRRVLSAQAGCWRFLIIFPNQTRFFKLNYLVLEGWSCVLATQGPSVIEEKGEGFENGKVFLA